MKFNKLVLTTAVCAALGGVNSTVHAAVTGVPGEAGLVPLVMTGGASDSGYMDTYVTLRVPAQLGSDTVINMFTAPHTSTFGTITSQLAGGSRGLIHWFLRDVDSKPIVDDTCEVSAGDVVIWTTNPQLHFVQGLQNSFMTINTNDKFQNSICGPLARPNLGYVVFETEEGATGKDASFAFTGNASIEAAWLSWWTYPDISVPFVPMADGADAVANCGTYDSADYPQMGNEVITGDGSCAAAGEPLRVSPVVAGIRMNDLDQSKSEWVKTQMEIPGPGITDLQVGGYVGLSNPALHVHWFDRVDAARTSRGNVWDDQEGKCSDELALPHEVNAHLYNVSIAVPGGIDIETGSVRPNITWPDFYYDYAEAGEFTDLARIDLVALLGGSGYAYDPMKGYKSVNYCATPPDYWLAIWRNGSRIYPGALMGYREGGVKEINDAAANPNFVHSASVQFSAVGSYWANAAWRSHFATELGIF